MSSYHHYRVTYKGYYLFHCTGTDAQDALHEARILAARQGMRETVVRALSVSAA